MADELKASPENRYLAELSKALEWMAHPTVDGKEIKTRGLTIADLLPIESTGKVLGRLSRGEPLTTGAGGLGGTTRLQPDVRDFALDVAPFAGDVAKLAGKGVGALGKVAGEELNRRFLSGQMFPYGAPTANFVVKPKGGNWFANEVENNLKRLKSPYDPDYALEDLRQLREQYGELPAYARDEKLMLHNKALNNWVDKNLTNYVKKEMGTPEDPVRLMIDRRVEEIKQKHKEDLARVDKVAQRAIEETDPRRQANLQREADRLRLEAQSERDLNTKHVAHIPLDEELDNFDEMRTREGFPIEGMGKSLQAKNWENFSDSSIYPKKAGDIQQLPEKFAQAEIAKKEAEQAKIDLDARVSRHLKEKGLSLSDIQEKNFIDAMPYSEKENLIGDDSVTKAYQKLHNLQSFDDEYNLSRLKQDPDINKIAPEASIYSAQTGNLGFDHILDVLKEDLASGRIKPEDLKNISMEQAVRKTADYDLALAKKMQEAQAKKLEEMTVHKEYPEGMRWVQLDKPGQFSAESEAMGHSVRGYEPPEGHPDWIPESGDSGSSYYGHGGWEGIKSGRAKIYSLVDPKGNPHTTVETREGAHPIGYSFKGSSDAFPETFEYNRNFLENAPRITPEQHQAILNRAKEIHSSNPSSERMNAFQQASNEILGRLPEDITQIKGKQNRAPNEQYLPFVQDFVKSGNWSDVGDLQNTGLIEQHSLDRQIAKDQFGLDLPRFTTPQESKDYMGLDIDRYHKGANGLEIPESLLKYKIQPETTQPPVDLGTVGGTPNMKKGGKVRISDNPDVMQAEIMQRGFAGGGTVAKLAEELAEKLGKKIIPTAEAEANKAKFLSNSKVRDVLYHATPANFKEFQGEGFDPTISGNATWLSTNPHKQPAMHNIGGGRDAPFREGVNVMPVHVQAKSPLVLDDQGMIDWAREAYAGGHSEFPDLLTPNTVKMLKEDGYDSIIHADPYKVGREHEVIMLQPNQIKSAIGNQGTYDTSTPDITKKRGGSVHMAGGGFAKSLLKGEMTNLNENSKDSTMDAFLNLVPDVTSRFAPALAAALYTPNLNSGEDAELARRRTMPANIQSPAGFDPRGDMGLGNPKFNKGGKVKRTVHHLDGEEVHIVERKR